MPYVPRLGHLFKIMFRIRDPRAAEGLWFQASLLSEEGDDEGARLAFAHARLLDPEFGGAFYNYAALTEKLNGPGPAALKAWRQYLPVAERDPRQARETIEKVRRHVEDLQERFG